MLPRVYESSFLMIPHEPFCPSKIPATFSLHFWVFTLLFHSTAVFHLLLPQPPNAGSPAFPMTAVPSPSEIVVHQAPLGTKENQIYWSLFQIFLLFCGCFWNGVFLCRPDLSGLELGDLALLKLKVCTTTLGPRSILFLIMWLCVGIFVWVLMPSEAKERV